MTKYFLEKDWCVSDEHSRDEIGVAEKEATELFPCLELQFAI